MATPDGNTLDAMVRGMRMASGNQVLDTATGLPVTASRQNWVDSDSRFAVGQQQPFALGAMQSTVGGALFNLSGKSVVDVLSSTIVSGASVTTATKGAFVRVDVTTDDGTVAGSYYLELFVIT